MMHVITEKHKEQFKTITTDIDGLIAISMHLLENTTITRVERRKIKTSLQNHPSFQAHIYKIKSKLYCFDNETLPMRYARYNFVLKRLQKINYVPKPNSHFMGTMCWYCCSQYHYHWLGSGNQYDNVKRIRESSSHFLEFNFDWDVFMRMFPPNSVSTHRVYFHSQRHCKYLTEKRLHFYSRIYRNFLIENNMRKVVLEMHRYTYDNQQFDFLFRIFLCVDVFANKKSFYWNFANFLRKQFANDMTCFCETFCQFACFMDYLENTKIKHLLYSFCWQTASNWTYCLVDDVFGNDYLVGQMLGYLLAK